MKGLLYFALFSLKALATESPSVCEIGGYNYLGGYHSESYALPGVPPTAACKGREVMDARKLGVESRGNNEKINTLINKMMNDPKCAPLYESLNQYLNTVRYMRAKYDLDAQQRLELLERSWKKFDMQRDYAHMAVFNSTCAGQEHRGSAIVDLDGINNIAGAGGWPTIVKTNGQLITNCSNVVANGMDDLTGFSVSMKQAKGDKFLYYTDAYSVPDHIILKTSSGTVLHDTGCKGYENKINIPLSSLPNDKIVVIEIKGNCNNGGKKGESAWEAGIKCQQDPRACPEDVDELLRLMKAQVLYTNQTIDLHSTEMNCHVHYDVNILKDLQRSGLIFIDDVPYTNGICPLFDVKCEENRLQQAKKESVPELSLKGLIEKNSKGLFGEIGSAVCPPMDLECLDKLRKKLEKEKLEKNKVKDNSGEASNLVMAKSNEEKQPVILNFNGREIFDANCPRKIVSSDSVLKLVSRTYCTVGFRKLGLNLDSFKTNKN